MDFGMSLHPTLAQRPILRLVPSVLRRRSLLARGDNCNVAGVKLVEMVVQEDAQSSSMRVWRPSAFFFHTCLEFTELQGNRRYRCI